MDTIGVIPENPEILCSGLQRSKAAHGFIGISNAGGVGILGNAPDPLDSGIIVHQFLHHIHIRASGSHGNGNHFHTEVLGDTKVTVITGSRAQELYLLLTAPGLAACKAVGHGTGNGIEHHIQAGVASHNDLLSGHTEQLTKQRLHLRKAVGHAVVAAIFSGGSHQICGRTEDIQHGHGKIQLIHAGLASGHIQLQAHCLKFIVFCLQFLMQGAEFVLVYGLVFHSKHLHFLYNA